MMGDFNEVHKKDERFGSVFNVQGADVFNLFISNAGLDEVPLGGCAFTWCHKSAKKMSKLDRFLISESLMSSFKAELAELYAIIDKGEGNVEVVNKRMNVVKSLQELEKLQSLKAAQKAKIKWAIEGDENSKYYHGILNKKGINRILEAFWQKEARLHLDMNFPHNLTYDQQVDLEIDVSNEEIKKAVWDCGIDKSPGPDGFTFGFYRRFWNLIEKDVVNAVLYFFHHGSFPKGGNSTEFIAFVLCDECGVFVMEVEWTLI
ncbi:RNA-directed DNA polymerase, eukaryota, reverse transcriptase zinc-binding domain protein [Tanacetum coccineum]